MRAPDDSESWNQILIEPIINYLTNEKDQIEKGSVLIHCRGGIGRSGMLACNLLGRLYEFNQGIEII